MCRSERHICRSRRTRFYYYKKQESKTNYIPLPRKRGLMNFLRTACAPGHTERRAAREFERYYREQNCQKAEAAEEERAKAKRLES